MGADLHLYVEKKNKETGIWEIVKGKNPLIERYREASILWDKEEHRAQDPGRASYLRKLANEIESGARFRAEMRSEEQIRRDYPEDYDENSESIEEACDYEAPFTMKNWIYSGRNYDLFAILADVRNGRGFAGCDTGDGFKPIADPRGVPEDASPEYKKIVERWDSDGHSHSYHTLAHLKAYDWKGQSTVLRGVVDESEYVMFLAKGRPDMYSGGVFGGSSSMVSNEKMDKIIAEDSSKEKEHRYYTQVEWKESYEEASGYFNESVFPELEKLSEDGLGDDVRIIFFFDN